MNQQPEITEAQIRAIWQAHKLGRVKHIAPTAMGGRNDSFLVNGEVVIRVNTRDVGMMKFQNEVAALERLYDSGLPLPEVISFDDSGQVIPYDYIILTRLPGVSVAESAGRLDEGQVRNIIWEAGEALARLHSYHFEGFGKIQDIDLEPFPSWFAYFQDYAQRYMSAARDHGLVDADTLLRLETALYHALSDMEEVARGVLVHSDYHYENLLQENGRLTGVLDFEWAFSGDPSCDFVSDETRKDQLPGSEGVFREGYFSLRSFDSGHERRLRVYRLFWKLETAVMYADWGEWDNVPGAMEEMVRYLER